MVDDHLMQPQLHHCRHAFESSIDKELSVSSLSANNYPYWARFHLSAGLQYGLGRERRRPETDTNAQPR